MTLLEETIKKIKPLNQEAMEQAKKTVEQYCKAAGQLGPAGAGLGAHCWHYWQPQNRP